MILSKKFYNPVCIRFTTPSPSTKILQKKSQYMRPKALFLLIKGSFSYPTPPRFYCHNKGKSVRRLSSVLYDKEDGHPRVNGMASKAIRDTLRELVRRAFSARRPTEKPPRLFFNFFSCQHIDNDIIVIAEDVWP